MIHGVKDQPVEEHFTVSDAQGNLISGLDTTSDFTAYVYNPTGSNVTGSVSGFFTELGDGNYKYTFTPDENGVWYINVTNPEYFPWGKNDDVYVQETDLTEIYDIVRKTLGLVHSNMQIDQAVYDEFGNMIGARVRIYSDAASVGTNSNVIETYKIEADSEACGQFTYWKQVVSP
jgi:hypothetical protein